MKKKILATCIVTMMAFLPFIVPASDIFVAAALNNSGTRYTVLVLDVSGSMGGEPIEALREASIQFCEQIINKASGKNQVAIVTYHYNAEIVCDFTDNLSALTDAANNLYSLNNTNMEEGLRFADDLLSKIPDSANAEKNILLMSDGLPNEGGRVENGQYSSTDYAYYHYANAVYSVADTIKSKGCFIYTLGFFHSLSGDELLFAVRFLRDLQSAGYYDVEDSEDLAFTFGSIATAISETDDSPWIAYLLPLLTLAVVLGLLLGPPRRKRNRNSGAASSSRNAAQ